MNASELISSAYYFSGIRSRDLETVSGSDTADGLMLLNNILSEFSINPEMINYFVHSSFNAIPGQEEYDIPGLIELSTITFNIGDVRYEMRRDTRRTYFGDNRVDNISSLPFHFYAERILGGMRIYLYFVPDQNYVMKLNGKFSYAKITDPSQDLSSLEDYFVSYLQYKLASRLCEYFNVSFPMQAAATLAETQRKINNMVGVDLSINKTSMFPAKTLDIYVVANIGPWVP